MRMRSGVFSVCPSFCQNLVFCENDLVCHRALRDCCFLMTKLSVKSSGITQLGY